MDEEADIIIRIITGSVLLNPLLTSGGEYWIDRLGIFGLTSPRELQAGLKIQ